MTNIDSNTSNDDHAQEIIQTHYDGQAGAGYLKFCTCKYGHTEDLLAETTHGFLTDWDEKETHIIGLEILNFPLGGLKKAPLSTDLASTELSEKQKESIMTKFVKQ